MKNIYDDKSINNIVHSWNKINKRIHLIKIEINK